VVKKSHRVLLLENVFHQKGWIAFWEEVFRLYEEVYVKDGLRIPFSLAAKYLVVNKIDKAIDYYEESYELHDPSTPYLSVSFFFMMF
jgi:hypothetical protein